MPEGTVLARLRTVTPEDDDVPMSTINMPFDGRIASVDLFTGAVSQPEAPVVTVYDPAFMYVVVTVSPSTLRRLRQGMRAELRSSLVPDAIAGTVVSAVPLLGNAVEPADGDAVNVRIRPETDAVSALVPGIRFDASIDLDSAPDGALPLVVAPAATAGG